MVRISISTALLALPFARDFFVAATPLQRRQNYDREVLLANCANINTQAKKSIMGIYLQGGDYRHSPYGNYPDGTTLDDFAQVQGEGWAHWEGAVISAKPHYTRAQTVYSFINANAQATGTANFTQKVGTVRMDYEWGPRPYQATYYDCFRDNGQRLFTDKDLEGDRDANDQPTWSAHWNCDSFYICKFDRDGTAPR